MSDLMLLGVLRMPIDPNSGPVALTQFFARAREAADRIESDAAEIERLRAALAQPPAPTAQPAYVDSTPHLNVGNSAFEHWFQAQPFATQPGIKQISRDSYAAGMGDPLVMAKDAQPVQQPGAEPQPSGYESTTTYYTRWVSPERWAKFSPGVQKWYRPYWAPAQRQPLSDEQIDSLTFPFLTAELGPTAYDRAIARAIEAAHGITAATAAQKGEKL